MNCSLSDVVQYACNAPIAFLKSPLCFSHIIFKWSLKYKVKTISLEDLLVKYNAPNIIDYLSIDTEGSEYEILSKLDLSINT